MRDASGSSSSSASSTNEAAAAASPRLRALERSATTQCVTGLRRDDVPEAWRYGRADTAGCLTASASTSWAQVVVGPGGGFAAAAVGRAQGRQRAAMHAQHWASAQRCRRSCAGPQLAATGACMQQAGAPLYARAPCRCPRRRPCRARAGSSAAPTAAAPSATLSPARPGRCAQSTAAPAAAASPASWHSRPPGRWRPSRRR